MHSVGDKRRDIIISIFFINTGILETEKFSEDKKFCKCQKILFFILVLDFHRGMNTDFWLTISHLLVRCNKNAALHRLRHIAYHRCNLKLKSSFGHPPPFP